MIRPALIFSALAVMVAALYVINGATLSV